MNRRAQTLAAALALLASLTAAHAGDASPAVPPPRLAPAEHRAGALTSAMLAAASAGRHVVAVGERGTVLLSGDGGATFRQADAVPVATTLTGVSFVDEREGWAVGHGGVVLHTADGGRHWTLQRSDLERDQPLLAVHFFDARHGVAVGLWSLVLVTQDGGGSWQSVTLPSPPGARRIDLNLYGLFAAANGDLYACAEQGKLLRSGDRGNSWQVLDTGYRGSLWAGAALSDGSLLVGGLRGTLLRSGDGGATWQRLAEPAQSSITGIVQLGDGRILASALDGVTLASRDGLAFQTTQSDDRVALTAVVKVAGSVPLLMSRNGPRRQN